MAKEKTKNLKSLQSRIESLRAECEAFIESKAEEMAVPGVPVPVVRQLLTVRYPGDPCRAALSIIEKEGI